MYCLKCKKHTPDINIITTKTINNRHLQKSQCKICFAKKCCFTGGKLDIHEAIGKLPKPKKGFVLPKHKYTGPYNPLEKQLDKNDNPIPGQEPFNQVDRISMAHDICYRDFPNQKPSCDKAMLYNLKQMKSQNKRELFDKKLVQSIIGTKTKLGVGLWSEQLAAELHKPVKKKFPKRRVIVRGIDHTWASDLVDMSAFSKYNGGVKFLIANIDILSKYGWMIPLKSKTGKEVTKGFEKILSDGRIPRKIWTDKGREFYNKDFDALLKKYSITLYSTENEEKSPVVERFNRTIKEKMWKYFSANSTNKYIDVLQDLVNQYNNARHRSIKMTPIEASKKKNELSVLANLYGDLNPPAIKEKFSIGDKVRITVKKGHFEKGYTPRWTEEIFVITGVQKTNPITYKIADLSGEEVKGTFYEQELQKTKQETFRIEKVIRKRKSITGEDEVLVRWKGYPPKFDSWMKISETTKL